MSELSSSDADLGIRNNSSGKSSSSSSTSSYLTLTCLKFIRNRGSYMSAHVFLILLNELGKAIKCEACQEFYCFFEAILINSII